MILSMRSFHTLPFRGWLLATACFNLLCRGLSADRLVSLPGDPHARGRLLAQAGGSSILKLFANKRHVYASVAGALEKWTKLARQAAPYIRSHAPVAWAELQGMASAGISGLDEETLLMLAVEFDVYVDYTDVRGEMVSKEKCTGFATPGLAGQTNDEPPELYLHAEEDVVLSMEAPQEELGQHVRSGNSTDSVSALIYTHPGWPAYMGVNSNGLSVLWQYIDTGERNLNGGVPTTVLIREMVAQPSLEAALRLLRQAPRMVPNSFILTDPTTVVNVEVSPSHFTALSLERGYVVHTNHVLFDQRMKAADIGMQSAKTTFVRHEAMTKMVEAKRKEKSDASQNHLGTSELAEMLSTRPVFRDGKFGTDDHTLASMVFDSRTKSMAIRFKGDHEFRNYTVGGVFDGADVVAV